MRIFCAVRHSRDPGQYYGGLWSGNFYPALLELGHEIIESQVDLLPTSRFMIVADNFTHEELEVRAQTTERILNEVRAALRKGPVDLFLSYFYNSHFDPAGYDELRHLGIPSVNYYCNSIHQFKLVSKIAKKADFSWHAERDARNSYLAVGANPVWVQMGADPNVYHPVTVGKRKNKAVFVGQRYADRDRWIAAMVRAKVPVEIYGPGWGGDEIYSESVSSIVPKRRVSLGRSHHQPGSMSAYFDLIRSNFHREGIPRGLWRTFHQIQYRYETQKLYTLFSSQANPGIPFHKIASIFSSFEVCLNFSNVWADGRPGSELIPHVRLRDFEAPMCRTCYLTGHTDEISEFYEIGKEIDTYRTEDELVDKTRFYLKNPVAAEILREAGYRRALRDHTWKERFSELFFKLGLTRTKK